MALAFLPWGVDCVEKLGMSDASSINTEKKTAEKYHGLHTIQSQIMKSKFLASSITFTEVNETNLSDRVQQNNIYPSYSL